MEGYRNVVVLWCLLLCCALVLFLDKELLNEVRVGSIGYEEIESPLSVNRYHLKTIHAKKLFNNFTFIYIIQL